MEIIDSRDFKVPEGRIRKWANKVGLPKELDIVMADRAENSISEENDAAGSQSPVTESNAEPDTMDSG